MTFIGHGREADSYDCTGCHDGLDCHGPHVEVRVDSGDHGDTAAPLCLDCLDVGGWEVVAWLNGAEEDTTPRERGEE